MKKIQYFFKLIAIIFLLFTIPVPAICKPDEIFYVIHLDGEIRFKESSKIVKIGDELKSDSQIIFKTPKAEAIVIGPQSGYRTLGTDNLENEKKESELVGFVMYCFTPSRKNVSSRLPFINEEQMKAEIDVLISTLKKLEKTADEIEKESLAFLIDVYYGESNSNKAKEWLCKNYQQFNNEK